MWEQEVSLGSLVLMEFRDTQAKAGPGAGLAMTAAMGPGETQAHKDPPAPRAFPAPPGPKDPKDRKVNLMHCLKRTATNTGVNLGSLDWSDSRVLLAALDLWGRWV